MKVHERMFGDFFWESIPLQGEVMNGKPQMPSPEAAAEL